LMEKGARFIDGQFLQSVSHDAATKSTILEFDLHGRIELLPFGEPSDDQLLLYSPDNVWTLKHDGSIEIDKP
jgi:hypothetical protein